MVKLTDAELAGVESEGRLPRNHHNWGARFGRRRLDIRRDPEPKGLLDLEERTRRIVELMEKYSPKLEHNYERAMDLLRLQYNMNFIVVCEKCHGTHKNDEILAPER